MIHLKEHIDKKWGYLKTTHKFYIACSGGVDSIVLTAIFHQLGFEVEVLHVNYHLRGEDSNLDEEFVRIFCQERNIPIHVHQSDLKDYLESHHGNLQDLARTIRYTFFDTFLKQNPKSFLLLGHHLDDQIETFFLNIARKSGIRGMACMPEVKDQIIRPFLYFEKELILNFAKKNNIQWREDSSNESLKYNRNKLRNNILKSVKTSNTSINESIILLIEKFQETLAILSKQISKEIEQLKTNKYAIEVNHLANFSDEALFEWCYQLDLNHSIIPALKKLIHQEKGKFIPLEHPIFERIVKEKTTLQFVHKNIALKSSKLIQKEVDYLPSTFNQSEIYIDSSKIKGELTLRTWKAGDKMQPIGLKGHKLIADILKDDQVPHHIKENELVLCDNEAIIWCVNHRVSAQYVATSQTKKILYITLA